MSNIILSALQGASQLSVETTMSSWALSGYADLLLLLFVAVVIFGVIKDRDKIRLLKSAKIRRIKELISE